MKKEAARSILADEVDAGGDIFRMASNALRDEEAGPIRAKRVFLDEFPLNNQTHWRETMLSVFSFLFDIDHQFPSRRRLDDNFQSASTDEMLDVVFKSAFLADATHTKNKVENSGVHVTGHLISMEKRWALIRALKEDVVLGPLLGIFQKILLSKTHN